MKRKGQEEIVGFVLIVVIVVVAFVIFLGIKLRSPEPSQKQSEIVSQFLESAMEQTTDCELGNSRKVVMNDLIKECYSSSNTCASGETSCEVVEKTMIDILNNTWKVGPEFPYKGYEVKANYVDNSSSQQRDEVFLISQGNCNYSFDGNSYLIPEFPGSIIVDAKICS